MTMTELAKELGVSTQAVYKRLQRDGVDVATLKESGSKDLSQDGVDTIRLMFKGSPTVNKRTRKVHEDSLSTQSKIGLQQIVLDQGENIARLETENQMLREQLTEWKDRYDLLVRSALAMRVETLSAPESEKPSAVVADDPNQDQKSQPKKKRGWFHFKK